MAKLAAHFLRRCRLEQVRELVREWGGAQVVRSARGVGRYHAVNLPDVVEWEVDKAEGFAFGRGRRDVVYGERAVPYPYGHYMPFRAIGEGMQ